MSANGASFVFIIISTVHCQTANEMRYINIHVGLFVCKCSSTTCNMHHHTYIKHNGNRNGEKLCAIQNDVRGACCCTHKGCGAPNVTNCACVRLFCRDFKRFVFLLFSPFGHLHEIFCGFRSANWKNLHRRVQSQIVKIRNYSSSVDICSFIFSAVLASENS